MNDISDDSSNSISTSSTVNTFTPIDAKVRAAGRPGCCVLLVLIVERVLYVAHVGDCRAIICNELKRKITTVDQQEKKIDESKECVFKTKDFLLEQVYTLKFEEKRKTQSIITSILESDSQKESDQQGLLGLLEVGECASNGLCMGEPEGKPVLLTGPPSSILSENESALTKIAILNNGDAIQSEDYKVGEAQEHVLAQY